MSPPRPERDKHDDWFDDSPSESDLSPLTSSVPLPRLRRPVRKTPAPGSDPTDAASEEMDPEADSADASPSASGRARRPISGKRPKTRAAGSGSTRVPASDAPTRPVAPPTMDARDPSSESTLVEGRTSSSSERRMAGENAIRVIRGGKFRTRRKIGKGGAGTVMEARDLSLRRDVAVKRPHDEDDAASRLRFIEEAQITAQLQHPNIIPVYELGVDDADHPFIAMKRIVGRTFGELLVEDFHLRPGSQKEFLERLRHHLEIFRKACDAVAYAHDKGVIHRDLKPGNIMVGEFGEVLVVDWGLARPIGSLEEQMTFSQQAVTSDRRLASIDLSSVSGPVVGTLPYMPPEQAAGHPLQDVTGDVYSLGAILYVILCGRPPVSPSDPEPLAAVREGRFKPPTKHALDADWVPTELEAVALKAMEKSPRARYQSVEELAADIEAWLAGHTLAVVSYSTFARVRKWAARHWPAVLTGTVAAVVLLVSAVAFVLSLNDALTEAEHARDLARHEADRAMAAEQEARQAADAEREATAREREAARDAREQFAMSLVAQADALISADRLLEADDRLDEAAEVVTSIRGDRLPVDLARVEVMRANPPPLLADKAGADLCCRLPARGGDGECVVFADKSMLAAVDPVTLCERWRHDDAHATTIRAITAVSRHDWMASADADGTVRLWTRDGTPVGREDHHVGIHSLSASADGRYLAAGGDDGSFQVWTLGDDGSFNPGFRANRAHGGEIRAIAFSPDGALMATGGRDSIVRLIDLQEKKGVAAWRMMGMVRALAFSPDSAVLYAGGVGTRLHVFDVGTHQRLHVLAGHTNSITCIRVSDDGSTVVTSSYDGRVIARDRGDDYAIQRQLMWHQGVECFVVLADGRRVVGGDGRSRLVFDLQSPPPGDPPMPLVPASMWTVRVSPDGRRVCVSGGDGTNRIYDRGTGKLLEELRGHNDVTWDIALSDDGRFLFDASRDGVVLMWDISVGQPVRRFTGHTADVRALDVSPDGRILLTAGYDSTVRAFDVASGRQLWERPGPGHNQVLATGVSPDGSRGFAVARGVVNVFDLQTGERVATGELPEHAKSGNWISDDRVALGCANGQVVILDASDGHEVGEISGHVNSVFEVVVSPDGRWLATAGEDRTVRLHDAVAYREIRLLGSHAARVRSVAFTPDGTGLISTGDDGRIRHWPLDYVTRMRSARDRAVAARPVLADNASDGDALRDLTDWYATRGLYEVALQQIRQHSLPAGDSPAARLRRAALHWLAGDADGAFVRYSELMHDPDAPEDVRLHARLCARAVRR